MLNKLIAAAGNTEGFITNPAIGPLGQNPDSIGFIQKLLPAAVNIILIVGAVVFFFMLVTGAIKWISSSGDKQGLESARGTITNALIGIVILFASFAIIKLIESFFHVQILTIDIGSLIIQ